MQADPRWIKARLSGAIRQQNEAARLAADARQWAEVGMWDSARHCQTLAATNAWVARLWLTEGMLGRYLTNDETREI